MLVHRTYSSSTSNLNGQSKLDPLTTQNNVVGSKNKTDNQRPEKVRNQSKSM